LAHTKKLHLESLRGMAALSVAVFHFNIGTVFNNAFTENAHMMVDLFFVLSGYVIALNYADRITSFGEALAFQRRRLMRLYPLHLVMLLVFLGVEIAKYLVEKSSGLTATIPAFSSNNLESFVENLFLIHNLVNDHMTWNYPSWSISSEFFTYLLFAFLLLLARRIRIHPGILFLPFMIYGAIQLAENGLGSKEGIYRCFVSFFLGALLHEFEKRVLIKGHNAVALFLSALTVVAVANFPRLDGVYVLIFPALFLVTLMSLNSLSPASPIIRLLSHRWLVYLGTISYGIYMIHAAVWWGVTQFIRFVLKMPVQATADERIIITGADIFFLHGAQLAGIIIIFGMAHLSYRWIELPAMRRARKPAQE